MIVFVLFAGVSCATSPAFSEQEDFLLSSAQVNRVYDGDTFFIDLPYIAPVFGKDLGVRPRGYDTPEIHSKCDSEAVEEKVEALASQAKEELERLLKGSSVISLINVQRGKYFRITARVLVDGQDVGKVLIDEGYALSYSGTGPREDWCDIISQKGVY